MTDNVEEIMKFLENHYVGNKRYYVISSLYNEKEEWEIFLFPFRASGEGQWFIRRRDKSKPYEEPTDKRATLETVTDVIFDRRLDVLSLHKQVLSDVSSVVVFADKVVKDAKEKFGYDFVDQSISGYEQFAASLKEAITDIMRKSRLKSVK